MGYQVLARKYRPQRFSDVAGQDHVTRTLINALTQGRLAHGYIFSGHRGIGKTTIARILAMALDCRTEVGSDLRPTVEPCLQCVSCREISSGGNADGDILASNSFDFIEIDAASNRGIDDVRSICSQADVRPARDKYKIFLLDEAHQITDAAFNAILKTLEEPPEWAIFMMATTEPENIPQTIRSRCQHFSFHAVKFEDILQQLREIAEKENVTADEEALALLAEAGDGSMRDALSIMDQAIASAPVEQGRAILNAQQIRELMGSVPNAVFERLLEAVSAQQSATLMEELDRLISSGNSPASLARQLVRYLRNALMARLGGENTQLLAISQDERARAWRTAQLFTEDELTRNLQIALRTFDELNEFQEHRFHLEIGLLKLIQAQKLLPVEELLSGLNSSTPGAIAKPGAAPMRPSAAPAASAPASRPAAPAPTPARAVTPAPSAPAPSISPFASSAASPLSAIHAEASVIRPSHEAPIASLAEPSSLREPIASVLSAVPGITATALSLAPEPLTSG
ncbi:MAG TPA: DNA polymerase III subunit gamma/tau, partial [Acidobacteriaceae bacterium]|nr:DNA polymerase III subunit gamma/tau [Acidobacteriaceae bacterium]